MIWRSLEINNKWDSGVINLRDDGQDIEQGQATYFGVDNSMRIDDFTGPHYLLNHLPFNVVDSWMSFTYLAKWIWIRVTDHWES